MSDRPATPAEIFAHLDAAGYRDEPIAEIVDALAEVLARGIEDGDEAGHDRAFRHAEILAVAYLA